MAEFPPIPSSVCPRPRRAEISEREAYMEKLFDFNYAMEAVRSIIKGRQRDEAFAG